MSADGRIAEVTYTPGDTQQHRFRAAEFMIHALEVPDSALQPCVTQQQRALAQVAGSLVNEATFVRRRLCAIGGRIEHDERDRIVQKPTVLPRGQMIARSATARKEPVAASKSAEPYPRRKYFTGRLSALDGFASGRFETQADVQRFLENHPLYPKPRNGKLPHQRAGDMLRNVTYAGYVEAPNWDVPRRKGHHEPLISLETYQRIQDRLNGLRITYRTDLSADFPLRGFVHCDDCNGALTACWSISSGKERKRHPYYRCPHKGCPSYGKAIRRAVIEGEFEKLLLAARKAAPVPDDGRNAQGSGGNGNRAMSKASARRFVPRS